MNKEARNQDEPAKWVLKPVHGPVDFSLLTDLPLSQVLTLSCGLSPNAIAWGGVYVNCERVHNDVPVKPRDLIRVHLKPREFLSGEGQSTRIIAEHDDFIVVDKPAGIPVHATCDNARDNVHKHLETQLGVALAVCHRLDIGTEGLMVCAKVKSFRKWFGSELEKKNVVKRYRARVENYVAPGRYEHFQPRKNFGPYPMFAEASSDSRSCVMEVESCLSVGEQFEVSLRPQTGRHHQLRAQLAFLNAPIVGDSLYGSRTLLPVPGDGERIALQCYGLGFKDEKGRTYHFELAAPQSGW